MVGYGGGLAIQPEASSVAVGTAALVDVGFTDVSSLVGSYDLTIDWDPTLLALSNVTFGTNLDGPDNSIQEFTSGAGTVEVAEVSLGDLSNQTGFGSLPLFTLAFNTLAAGVSPLTFDLTANGGPIIGDESGASYTNFSLVNSSVQLTSSVPVPEPDTTLLLASGGCLVFMWHGWKQMRRRTEKIRPRAPGGSTGS
jgi:Cohesin domain